MPDEPEVQNPAEDAAEAVAEAEEILTPSEELEQAQFEDELAINGMGGDEPDAEEAEEDATPPPPTEKKRLADLVKDDPDLAAEFQQLTAQQAETQARQLAAQQQQQQYFQNLQQDYQNRKNAYSNEYYGRDAIRAQLDAYGSQDVIAAQELRDQWNGYWAEQDQNWAYTNDSYQRQTQTWQATAQARTAEQQAFFQAYDRFFKAKLPKPIQDALSGKRYGGSYQDGWVANLGDLADQLIAHGRQVEREESAARVKASRAARAANAQQQLAQETPVITSSGSGGGSRIPTPQEVDTWPLEKRLEELKKNPRLYDQVELAAAGGPRRR